MFLSLFKIYYESFFFQFHFMKLFSSDATIFFEMVFLPLKTWKKIRTEKFLISSPISFSVLPILFLFSVFISFLNCLNLTEAKKSRDPENSVPLQRGPLAPRLSGPHPALVTIQHYKISKNLQVTLIMYEFICKYVVQLNAWIIVRYEKTHNCSTTHKNFVKSPKKSCKG